MKLTTIFIATASALSITSATAQSLPDNMYIDGYIDISGSDISGSGHTLGRANLNFGLKPNRDGRFGVGFSIGINAVDFSSTTISQAVAYPAITFTLGNTGLLSVGVPRPVLNHGYIPQDTLAHSAAVNIFLDSTQLLPNSLASQVYQYDSSRPNLYGLRYDGEFGNTKIGVSYQRMGDVEADIYSIAFQHQLGSIGRMGDTKLFGGIERLDFDTGLIINTYILGAEANTDKLRTGLKLSKRELHGFINVVSANLYTDYKITNSFSLVGSILYIDTDGGGANADIYGLGMEYQFLNGGYLNASYSTGDLDSKKDVIEVSLGWRF